MMRRGGFWRRLLIALVDAAPTFHRVATKRSESVAAANLPGTAPHEAAQRGNHREEALAAIIKAVDGYRELAQTRPDAFLPDLATSLNNLSNTLGELGRREEALAAITEAVEGYRRLALARPDDFLPDLAGSLNNLSIRLAELGRREDAL